jgi:hypothetical protein
MASRRQWNGVWEIEKPNSLTEWLAGRNLPRRSRKKAETAAAEITAVELAAAILAGPPANGVHDLKDVRGFAMLSTDKTTNARNTFSDPRVSNNNLSNLRHQVEENKEVTVSGANGPASTASLSDHESGPNERSSEAINAAAAATVAVPRKPQPRTCQLIMPLELMSKFCSNNF